MSATERETVRCAKCGRECDPVGNDDAPAILCVDCATERETEGLIREAREFVTETADGHCIDECGPANDFIARLADALAAQRAEIARLREEKAGADTVRDYAIAQSEKWRTALASVTADSARLARSLRGYGQHGVYCEVGTGPGAVCTCGFRAAIDDARLIPPPNRPHAAATNRLREYLAYARDGHQIALTKGEAGALLDLLDSSPTPTHAAPSANPAGTPETPT